MFHPGETVSQTFTIPFVPSEVVKVIVTYKQENHVILTKTITSGIEPTEEIVQARFTVTLSQKESLTFKEKTAYTIQLNVLSDNGSRSASCEIKEETGPQHVKEVISSV